MISAVSEPFPHIRNLLHDRIKEKLTPIFIRIDQFWANKGHFYHLHEHTFQILILYFLANQFSLSLQTDVPKSQTPSANTVQHSPNGGWSNFQPKKYTRKPFSRAFLMKHALFLQWKDFMLLKNSGLMPLCHLTPSTVTFSQPRGAYILKDENENKKSLTNDSFPPFWATAQLFLD